MQYGLKMLREIQLAALRLDPRQHMEESKLKRNENSAYTVKDDKSHHKGIGLDKTFLKKAFEAECWCCREKGHTAQFCKKLRSTLSKLHEQKGSSVEQQEQAMVARSLIYLDSGATSHMTNQSDWLEDYEELEGAYMKVGDGTKLAIKGKGLLPLTIKTIDGDVEYEALNVLYVPELTDTLLSIGEIAKEGHTATFKGNAVQIQFDKGSSLEVE